MTTTAETTAEAASAADAITNAARRVWRLGLGAAILLGEQGERLIQAMEDRGRECEPKVSEKLRKAGDSIGRRAGKFESLIDKRVSTAVEGVSARIDTELASLGKKVDDLNAKIDELTRRRQSAPDQPE